MSYHHDNHHYKNAPDIDHTGYYEYTVTVDSSHAKLFHFEKTRFLRSFGVEIRAEVLENYFTKEELR